MTKNRELDCVDLFECEHELEIPVSVNGEIIYWRCVCGQHSKHVSDIEPAIHERKAPGS